MKSAVAALVYLAIAVQASPFKRAFSAASYAGQSSSDTYPAATATPNTVDFPPESVVGNTGPTPTGVEPFAVATAPAYPSGTQAFAPLVRPVPQDGTPTDPDAVFKNWGNLSPQHPVDSKQYGLEGASPILPDNCEITQVHLLYRHGARYPTSGSLPSAFAGNLTNAIAEGTGFTATGPLEFLNNWSFKLGAELLTPNGRQQNFMLGVQFRYLYGHLLNNFTESGNLPVFRTESQDRMVKTAENFLAGFFGLPYEDKVNLELMVEAKGLNNTGASYETCTNANTALGGLGSTASKAYAEKVFAGTVSRLQQNLQGYNLSATDVVAMLQLCAYETHGLGYSKFCNLFTLDEFERFEYYFDVMFYYNNFFGNPTAAAQGKGWVEELVSRLTQTRITTSDSNVNVSLESPTLFPLDQSIYADATHEVIVADILTALNLTALAKGPLPLTDSKHPFQRDQAPLTLPTEPESQTFVASNVVPFATRAVVQVLECASSQPTKQIRFIVNDAVVPIDNYPGCSPDPNGLCAFDTVVAALKTRLSEIDFDYACFGNYTATPGMDYNGLPPKPQSSQA